VEGRFTSEELELAKSVDLVDVAAYLGYTPKKIGKYYTLKEMDSIRIYNRSHWYRWSRAEDRGNNGGSQIDFLRVFAGLDIKSAVFWLLDFAGYSSNQSRDENINLKHQVVQQEKVKKEFLLPVPAPDNSFLYEYLMNDRGIRKEVIDYFVSRGLIYEARHYHNIVFKGNDKDGITRFASMRGVFDKQGKPFKCDVEGNDKRFGFNVSNEQSSELIVFEAAIDLMSYVDIFDDYDSNKLALGMVSDGPITTFLAEHPQITLIRFCLDRDEAGRNATEQLMEKYYSLGYEVQNVPPPEGYKDYNEWLVNAKIKSASISASKISKC
jgi:hypothetical protein